MEDKTTFSYESQLDVLKFVYRRLTMLKGYLNVNQFDTYQFYLEKLNDALKDAMSIEDDYAKSWVWNQQVDFLTAQVMHEIASLKEQLEQ